MSSTSSTGPGPWWGQRWAAALTDPRSIRQEAPAALARARAAAAAAAGKAGEHTLILDLRGQTLIADFFVICTATSRVHMRAVRDGIEAAMAQSHHRLWAREGNEEAQWVLLDYGDVIVHLMSEERRAYYKLERMWHGAAEVPLAGRSG